VVDDIRTRLSSIPNFVIQHVSRGANSAAHTLAKLVLTLPSNVWMEECPLPINLHLINAKQHFIKKKKKKKKRLNLHIPINLSF